MFTGGDDAGGDAGPLDQLVGVHVAQLEACAQQTAQTAVNVLLRQLAATDGLRQLAIGVATLHVSASTDSLGRGIDGVRRDVVIVGQKVPDGAAVARDESAEAPVLPQDLMFVAVLGAAGLAVDALIGAHHLSHALVDQCLEGRQIGFPEVALRQVLDVERMAVPLRTAMHGEVLGTGQQLAILGVLGPLQAAYDGRAHATGQEGVLAVGLLSASPPRVAEDVDIGCPERQAGILLQGAVAAGQRVLGARLVADSGEDLLDELVVP